jgi:hypothetical protein
MARALHGHNACAEISPKALSRLNFQVKQSEKFGLATSPQRNGVAIARWATAALPLTLLPPRVPAHHDLADLFQLAGSSRNLVTASPVMPGGSLWVRWASCATASLMPNSRTMARHGAFGCSFSACCSKIGEPALGGPHGFQRVERRHARPCLVEIETGIGETDPALGCADRKCQGETLTFEPALVRD